MIGEGTLKYLLIPVAVLFSASAQILLKKTAGYENWSREWLIFLIISCLLYGISFFVYLYLLRVHPISKIYPTLTIVVIVAITVYGILIGEKVSVKNYIGLALGLGSVYLVLG